MILRHTKRTKMTITMGMIEKRILQTEIEKHNSNFRENNETDEEHEQ